MKPDEIGILIVDDEASVRDSLYQWFTADGYRVDTADDASGALKKLQESPWDIILLDIKIIVLSAYPNEEAFSRMRKDGADACFPKPFPLAQLKREVARLLGLGK